VPPVTISAGVSEALYSDSWGGLVARADMALDHAILAGRNCVADA
jgi:GGDEF domain-containing protein